MAYSKIGYTKLPDDMGSLAQQAFIDTATIFKETNSLVTQRPLREKLLKRGALLLYQPSFILQ